jgi:hypothetical protein
MDMMITLTPESRTLIKPNRFDQLVRGIEMDGGKITTDGPAQSRVQQGVAGT